MIGELALHRRIMIDRGYVFVTDPTPTAHPFLDHLLGKLIQRPSAISLTNCLRDQALLYESWLQHLVRAGLLRPEAACHPSGGTRYVPDPEVRDPALTRLRYLLNGCAEQDPRTVALAGIVHGSGLGDDLIPFPADRAALAVFGQQDPIGQAIMAIHTEDRRSADAQAGTFLMVLPLSATPGGC
ncbi:GPP34 family phosphoprotein [Saccharopolyspora shandongensis]|uniref:GOLPH3/VPS74 family protein n=1 Tax=Saccharopolyspora shandongensis TaxID=418495 RepID=UPI003438D2EE